MSFTRRTTGAVGAWVVFMLFGVHQAIAGSASPPSPVIPAQPVESDTVVAVPPAKSTPDKNSLKDPFLTNHELQQVLRKGYTQETTLSGTFVYCRKEVRLGTFIPKQYCVTGAQLMGWPMTPITPIPIP
jgi:hypothetical protein